MLLGNKRWFESEPLHHAMMHGMQKFMSKRRGPPHPRSETVRRFMRLTPGV